MDDVLVDFSERGQPAAVLRYLPPGVTRLLVDVGAYDGIQGSNSRQFLLNGWRGVLIEPMPPIFRLLQQNSRDLGEVHLFDCAVADRNGRAAIRYNFRNETGQCASLYIHARNDARYQVEVLTLNTVLARVRAPSQFGLLLIDAEGGDLEVLKGINFARYQPAVILTEDFAPKDREKHRLLIQAGYAYRGRAGADSIWTSRRLVGDDVWPEQSPDLVRQVEPATFLIQTREGGGMYRIDEINDDVTFARGWSFTAVGQPPPCHVAAVIQFADGSWACFRGFRCPRTDVAQHFSDAGLLMSGFKIHLPAGLKRKSIVSLRLAQSDGNVCHLGPNVNL